MVIICSSHSPLPVFHLWVEMLAMDGCSHLHVVPTAHCSKWDSSPILPSFLAQLSHSDAKDNC